MTLNTSDFDNLEIVCLKDALQFLHFLLEILILQLDLIIILLHLFIFILKTEHVLHEELRHCLDALMLLCLAAQELHQAFLARNFFIFTLVFVLLLIRAEDLLLTLVTGDLFHRTIESMSDLVLA